jgi:hypothetical protein
MAGPNANAANGCRMSSDAASSYAMATREALNEKEAPHSLRNE